jgi:hypothetical protein
MSLALAVDIWNLLRESVPYEDRSGLADAVVSVLLDHGYDAGDISYEFNDDIDIVSAASSYLEDDDIDDEDFSDDDDNW